MTEYSISLEDIRACLATVPAGEPVGIPQHNYDCLIGKAIQKKYHAQLGHIGYHNQYVSVGGQNIEPPEEVQEIGEKFDDLWEHWGNGEDYEDWEPVTLATLRDRIPELFEGGN